ncbi:MAG: T9SS type A sorting domain-containing protein [bacterium]
MHKKLGAWIFVGVIGVINLALAGAPDTLWTRTYGGTDNDWGNSVLETQDGGIVVSGWTASFGVGSQNFYLIKTNSSGDTLWTRTYGGHLLNNGYCVSETQDSGFVIVGETFSFGAGAPSYSNAYLVRTNSLGDTLWTRTYGGTKGECGWSVSKTYDGGFIITGETTSFGAGSPNYSNVYLVKTNSSGDALWTKTFGGATGNSGWSVSETQDSGFIIVGTTNSFGIGSPNYSNVYLVRTNSSGDTLWTRAFGGTDNDGCYSVSETQDNGFIMVGTTSSFGAGGHDVYLIKTNSSGDTLCTRTYGGAKDDWGESVSETQDSGFIIAAKTVSFGAGHFDVYLIRTNSSGDTLWTKTIGGAESEWGCSVSETRDRGFIVAGATYGDDYEDVYLIRLKPETGIEENSNIKNQKLNMEIFKNPFIENTTINYSLTLKSKVSLSICDISGRTVKTLLNEQKPASSYSINLNAKELKTGIYFLTLNANGARTNKKLTIIK